MTVAVLYAASDAGRSALAAAAAECTTHNAALLVLVSRGEAGEAARPAVLASVEEEVNDVVPTAVSRTIELIGPDTAADTVDSLLARVEEVAPRVLVIGNRRRSAVGKLLMGRDIQRLLLEVPVPILLVKPQA
ncbi:hypothetical protein Kisp01_41130 [Kineosporia sp. NBRC 101677]|uniref:universal stress protein n=1 Tax=Kineosporia sp. NBRC 101677 TaxID=3032197 RepID=UPI0024A28C9E|nr:universal stress protein [Kineosporia sp. NBRC 101677]GLY17098.1 hypothetical protein Kisp01_41130 [Kineosporia sp. NBRC 101677]